MGLSTDRERMNGWGCGVIARAQCFDTSPSEASESAERTA